MCASGDTSITVEVSAARAEVGDQSDRALIEQGGDREDQRPGREHAPRDALDRAPRVAESDLAGQQRVDDSVQLGRAERRLEPVQLPPKSTSATRSRRARCALASDVAARTAASSVPLAPSCASANVSSSSTTSLECSGWRSVTYSAPRRAVARQLTCRDRSPTANGRMSANSIPSPRARATWAPKNGWVRSGATSSRSRCSRGNTRIDTPTSKAS